MAEEAAAAVPVPIPGEPEPGIDFILHAIGFLDAANRNSIMVAGLADYSDFREINEKDIRDMAEDFGKRTVANGRIIFGLGRIKKLIGVMHWIQDCYRTSDVPNHLDFNEDVLAQARSRAIIRQNEKDLVETNAKAAKPGKFKQETTWPEWQKAFTNYLSVIPGSNGVPLSYVIRENEDVGLADTVYDTFKERMIARAPHTGEYWLADKQRVHTLLLSFLQGEKTESWIRPLDRYQDGRRDMIALRRHYSGEGNSTRRISDAQHIRQTLHYKSERFLQFNTFLDSLQKMFSIYEEEGEPLSERAKVDELLSKIQCPQLAAAVSQLRFQLDLGTITFTVAANHLNSAVSQTSDFRVSRRNVGSVDTQHRGGGTGGRGAGGRDYNRGRRSDGGRGRGRSNNRGGPNRIRGGGPATTYYSPAEWNKLSFEERDKIRKARDKKGEQGGTKDAKRSIGDLSVEQFQAIIGAISKEPSTAESEAETPKTNNAGNAFGGKEGAKRAKVS